MIFLKQRFLSYLILLIVIHSAYIFSLHILHLSFHKGCLQEIEMIAQQLNITVTSCFIPDLPPQKFDGISTGNALYNIGHQRAKNIWNKHKDYFNQFDAIITSDTAPLARIFLQNNYTKPLIIWICNRFDYSDQNSLDCDFPDTEYYSLFQEATNKKNVFIVPYNAFESFYAAQKNVFCNNEVIQPSGLFIVQNKPSAIPTYINKSQTFFIPPYLNDISVNVAQECAHLGITTYNGRYNGPNDLQEFKGIIHVPYAWSNVAFFENIQNGLPYFIPSINFMIKKFNTNKIWWPNGNYFKNNYYLSEWYNEKNSEIITYFDSWDDLKHKLECTNFDELHTKIKLYAQQHRTETINKWNKIFTQISTNPC